MPRLRGLRAKASEEQGAQAGAVTTAVATTSASPSALASSSSSSGALVPVAAAKTRRGGHGPRLVQQIPADILDNAELNAEMAAALPAHYSFEIHKTIHRLRVTHSRCVALQFPEGLLMYACIIADLLERHAGVEAIIMGDVTYGACCVDDFSARALGADFMVHYGHSCLVPVDVTAAKGLNMLYVFVDIQFDVGHFVASVRRNFPAGERLCVAGTIQFATGLQAARRQLEADFAQVDVPQAKPLSRGEVLGCTSPVIPEGAFDRVVFVADGRFHLESVMVQNPHIKHFNKYNPYDKTLTEETYDHGAMHALRRAAIDTARRARVWGLVLGTLGRQGNTAVLKRVRDALRARGLPFVTILLSEVFPDKLALLDQVDCWVQVACPRLSIDWGHHFRRPLLSPYEAMVALGEQQWRSVYPMDYYRRDGGQWSNYAQCRRCQGPGADADSSAGGEGQGKCSCGRQSGGCGANGGAGAGAADVAAAAAGKGQNNPIAARRARRQQQRIERNKQRQHVRVGLEEEGPAAMAAATPTDATAEVATAETTGAGAAGADAVSELAGP